MTGAHLIVSQCSLRKRQNATRRQNPITLDHRRAIMQGSIGKEDRRQQFSGHLGIELHTKIGHVTQPRCALKDDQRTKSPLRQLFDRLDHLVDQILGCCAFIAADQKGHGTTDPLQGAPQFRLKDHRQCNQNIGRAIAQQPVERS